MVPVLAVRVDKFANSYVREVSNGDITDRKNCGSMHASYSK
jgi:hypothetical protein